MTNGVATAPSPFRAAPELVRHVRSGQEAIGPIPRPHPATEITTASRWPRSTVRNRQVRVELAHRTEHADQRQPSWGERRNHAHKGAGRSADGSGTPAKYASREVCAGRTTVPPAPTAFATKARCAARDSGADPARPDPTRMPKTGRPPTSRRPRDLTNLGPGWRAAPTRIGRHCTTWMCGSPGRTRATVDRLERTSRAARAGQTSEDPATERRWRPAMVGGQRVQWEPGPVDREHRRPRRANTSRCGHADRARRRSLIAHDYPLHTPPYGFTVRYVWSGATVEAEDGPGRVSRSASAGRPGGGEPIADGSARRREAST